MLDQISRRSSGLGAQGGHWKGQNIPKGSLESQLPAGQDSGIHVISLQEQAPPVRLSVAALTSAGRKGGRDTGHFGVSFKPRH